MKFVLDPLEVRVLGALLEKDFLTPDNYPLSLSALTAACNQKSSRDPVMELDEATVITALESLRKKHVVRERSGAGSRVPKYAHRLSGNLDPKDDFSPPERTVLALLMLRGPQTAGELRTRSGRMHEFREVQEVEETLLNLMTRHDGPFVAELPRQPGQREQRFMHLLSGEQPPEPVAPPAMAGSTADRVAALEVEVAAMKEEIADLRAQLAGLRGEPAER